MPLRLVALLVGAAAFAGASMAYAHGEHADCECDPGKSAEEKQECACCQAPPALNSTAETILGEKVHLSRYLGKVVMIVNVASKCGATPQYADLQALHETYAERGLAILAFPCNQFGQQEPGTNEAIAAFCKEKYDVSFDLFAKIDVNGETASPLYQYLTGEDCPIEDQGEVKWNFEKFLLDREGNVIARYRTKIKPSDPQIVEAIEAALGPAEPPPATAAAQ